MTKVDPRVVEALQLIAVHRQDLNSLLKEASSIGFETANERLKRWKSRTVRMLRSNINHSEADRLLKMRGDFFVRRGGPLSDVYSDGERYNAFLVALEVEIKEHPEAVFQAPLPAAPQEIKVELPSVDEIGSLFMVMMS